MLSEYRRAARAVLQGNWFKLAMVSFGLAIVYPVIAIILYSHFLPNDITVTLAKALHGEDLFLAQRASEMIEDAISKGMMIAMVVTFVISPIFVGLCWAFTGLIRQEPDPIQLIFQPAQKYYFKSVLIYALKNLLIVAGLSLFFIPGIFFYVALSMVHFVQRDKPELNVFETLTYSFRLLKGYKMDLFILYLTFIGWLILVFFSATFLTSFFVQFFASHIDQNLIMSVLIEIEKTSSYALLNYDVLLSMVQQSFNLLFIFMMVLSLVFNFLFAFLAIYVRSTVAVMYEKIIRSQNPTSNGLPSSDEASYVNSNKSSMDA